MKSFAIKTEHFEGPLDLLIGLIERRKLLVNDFSIAQVTDDYLTHVAALEERSLKDVAQFVALASTLLLIKSRSLLPVFEITRDEEDDIDDLGERLRVYQVYRAAARILAKRFGRTPLAFRPYKPDVTPLFIPLPEHDCGSLRDVIGRVLADLPRLVALPRVHVKKAVTLEEVIGRLRERLSRRIRLCFSDFVGSNAERGTTIVSFLAVLEMVRQGHIDTDQKVHFGDIDITSEENGAETPRYG